MTTYMVKLVDIEWDDCSGLPTEYSAEVDADNREEAIDSAIESATEATGYCISFVNVEKAERKYRVPFQ